jgi:hypothetical protein
MKPGGRGRKGRTAAGSLIEADSDNNPRDDVAKDFFLHDRREPLDRLAAWLYQVHNHIAVTRPQDTGRQPQQHH